MMDRERQREKKKSSLSYHWLDGLRAEGRVYKSQHLK